MKSRMCSKKGNDINMPLSIALSSSINLEEAFRPCLRMLLYQVMVSYHSSHSGPWAIPVAGTIGALVCENNHNSTPYGYRIVCPAISMNLVVI